MHSINVRITAPLRKKKMNKHWLIWLIYCA